MAQVSILHSMWHVKSVQFPIHLIFLKPPKSYKSQVTKGHFGINLCIDVSRAKTFIVDWNYSSRIVTTNEFM